MRQELTELGNVGAYFYFVCLSDQVAAGIVGVRSVGIQMRNVRAAKASGVCDIIRGVGKPQNGHAGVGEAET